MEFLISIFLNSFDNDLQKSIYVVSICKTLPLNVKHTRAIYFFYVVQIFEIVDQAKEQFYVDSVAYVIVY